MIIVVMTIVIILTLLLLTITTIITLSRYSLSCRRKQHNTQTFRMKLWVKDQLDAQLRCIKPAHRTVTYREYYSRCCINKILPPEDEHRVARNMQRIIIINVLYDVIVHQVGHLPTAIPGCTVSKT